ncbi:MAG: aldo/keto reductase [Candidatus Rifleibacteriota bacterium]
MQYRRLGKTEEHVSILGFGCMRFPIIDNQTHNIDRPQALKMMRFAIDQGVNYIDTAYPYHGYGFDRGGESEPMVAEALRDGYRNKVKIATKLPSWLISCHDDFDKYLNEQLKRLEAEQIDFYLVHALNKAFWANMKKHDLFSFLDRALKDGRIKHAGFSFHDDYPTFVEIVDAYDWSFCQIQYNYIDTDYQAGQKGLEYAAARDLGIVIMEPLRGGALTRNLPNEVLQQFESFAESRTPAEWALRWLWNHQQIGVVLSGMSDLQQTRENVASANSLKPEPMSATELRIIENVQKIYREKIKVHCTACRYCMPCPVGVDIPMNFQMFNSFYLFDKAAQDSVRFQYGMLVPEPYRAGRCVKCGKCVSHCPQNIGIPDELEKVHQLFSGD